MSGRRRCVLVTGSSGKLGGDFIRLHGDDYDIVQLTLEPPEDEAVRTCGRLVVGSVTD